MSSVPSGDFDGSNSEDRLSFIETVRYHGSEGSSTGTGASRPLAPDWNQYVHPNGDVYYLNHQLRLITPDDISDPVVLQYVLDARDDHIEVIEEDPNVSRLPADWEITVSDVSDTTAVIGMYSRQRGEAYEWKEDEGRIVVKPRPHFWSHVSEYPSHHPQLPPNTEEEFVEAVNQAKIRLMSGEVFPFTEQQIDQIISLYHRLKARDNIPALGWLIGVVMPLESVGTRLNGNLEALMEDLHV